MCLELEGDLGDGDGFYWLWNLWSTGVVLHQRPYDLILLSRPALLVYGRIVVIGSHMSSIFPILEIICACRQAEVSASMDDVQIERLISLQQTFEIRLKVFDLQAIPLLSPVSQPSSIHLPSKDHAIPEILREFKRPKLLQMVAFTQSKTCTRPVVLHPVHIGILIVEIALNTQISPHLQKVKGMLVVTIVRTKFVLDLEKNDAASVDVEIRLDHFGQSFEVGINFSFIGCIGCSYCQTTMLQQPCWQPTEIPLRTHIRTRPQQYLQPVLLGKFQEANQIPLPLRKIKHALFNLMMVPKYVDSHRVQAEPLDHLQPMLPVLPWNTGKVDLSTAKGRKAQDVVHLSITTALRFLYYVASVPPSILEVHCCGREECKFIQS